MVQPEPWRIDPAIHGAGLGLRRGLMAPLSEHADAVASAVNFMEVAPENWVGLGGRWKRRFAEFSDQYPLVSHGLSLSLGGPEPLDMGFLHDVRHFLRDNDVRCYTEHLSYCSDHGHLYDLMPIPFTEEAVHHAAARIRQVQDFLGQRIGIEHVSYYAAPGQQMSELDFVCAVLEEADCGLLLDVNNAYVNSINHGYDAAQYISGLPGERIMYVHVAGHFDEAADLKVDTHGSAVTDPVWALLSHAYAEFGVLPTLLERDFNFPSVPELLSEVRQIRALQSAGESAAGGAAVR
ncbi:HvfB family MNIO-type RiPP peptide maturase [Alcanivorax limicola]